MKADLIITHAKIFHHQQPQFIAGDSLAILGDKIVAVGVETEVQNLVGPHTKKIDARGNWVLPAFTDSHTHLTGYAARKLQVDLSDCATLEEAVARIREMVEQRPAGSWITGGGWDKNVWNLKDFPDRQILDNISTRHFIALDSKDWHSLWVNTPVLEYCHITSRLRDPKGGKIIRHPEAGEPTGILQETARELVYRKIPPLPSDQLVRVLRATFSEFHSQGIVSVHSMETPSEFALYQHMYREGLLGLRIFYYFPVRFLKQALALGLESSFGNSFLKISGVKIFMDGALGSQSAEMLENYEGSSHSGIEVLTEQELEDIVDQCVSGRLACAVHAIGDRANRKVLNVLEKYAEQSRQFKLAHRIEHAQLVHPEDQPRFARSGVTASAQPIHLASDIPLIEQHWGSRGKYAYPFGSLLKSGANLIFGSDTPIESFNPWKALYTAVTRKYLCRPEEPSFYPEESVDVVTGVLAYTLNSAKVVGMADRAGQLQPGYLADLMIIDRDIFQGPPESLLEVEVLLTTLSGKIVHQKIDF